MTIQKVFAIVLKWRILLTVVALSAPLFVTYDPTFPYADAILKPLGSNVLTAWANFDGVHYLTIIDKGYIGTGAIQAFFPLYPLLVRMISLFTFNPVVAGVLISTASLIGALFILHKLIRLDFDQPIAQKTIILMLLFPTAFFFTAMYTESLFLFLSVMSLYQARKHRFFLAVMFAALASATRVTGILLMPVLFMEYFSNPKNIKGSLIKKITSTIGLLASSTGLLAFMHYLKTHFSDPLLFMHVQSQFGAGRQTDKFIMIYQVFWRYIKMLFTVDTRNYIYFTIVSEFFIAILFLFLIVVSFKFIRPSYALYALASYLIPTFTGTFTSLPRYVLVLFPAFIVMAKLANGRFFKVVCLISGILLCINTILFIQGYWIA